MVFLSPDFAKLRFRKTLRQKEGSFALNGVLYALFFAVEENRSVAQIAAELGISLADARQGLERLCTQGMIAPLPDQGPWLPNRTMAQIQHHFGLAMGGQSGANNEMLQLIRQLSEDGRHIHLAQARTFLNQLCDRIPKAEARHRFRTQVVTLLKAHKAPSDPISAATPKRSVATSRGRSHAIIQAIIESRSQNKPGNVPQIKAAFRQHGIDPDHYGAESPDDPQIVARLERMARKTGVRLPVQRPHRTVAELRRLLDAIIQQRHGETPSLARRLRQQLRLKGIHPGDEDSDRMVDAHTLDQIQRLAGELGIDTAALSKTANPPATRGRTKAALDRILRFHSTGAPHRALALRTKLLLRGIDPDAYTAQTPDDPAVLCQVEEIANRLGLTP